MMRLELVDGWKWVGYVFLLLLADAAHQVAAQVMMDRGRLFWDIKNLSFCCFLVAIKFLSHFIG